MWHLYYYVPPCPRCGSRKTGRYLRITFMNHGKSVEESLRHGEIAREVSTVPYENCFCEDCDYEWHSRVLARMLTKAEYDEEIRVREIRAKQKAYREQNGDKKESRFSIQRRFF